MNPSASILVGSADNAASGILARCQASAIEEAIMDNDITVAVSVRQPELSKAASHPLSTANYLASPPLVVAYAIAGNMNVDVYNDPLPR